MLNNRYIGQAKTDIQKPAKEVSSTFDKMIFTVITTAMCFTNMLLPIERGFAVVQIASFPIALPTIISLASFIILFSTQKTFLSSLFPKYIVVQLIFILYLILITAFTVDATYSVFVILSYSVTFVVNFWIVYHFLKQGFGHGFVVIICSVAFVASLIGILEGILGLNIPFYRQYLINPETANFFNDSVVTPFSKRVFGTLGNPIVYSVTLALVIPFLFDLKSRIIKIILLTSIVIASILTIATTSIIVIAIFLLGQFVVSVRNPFLILRTLVLIVLFMFIASSIVSEYVPESFLQEWSDEADPNNQNIVIRIETVEQAIALILYESSPSEALLGHGIGTARVAALQLNIGMNTFDNTYLSIYYELGLIGLFFYTIIYIYLLLRFISYSNKSLYWYSVLALFLMSFAFFTTYYFTFNFIWTASVAFLVFRSQSGNMHD